jgi:hypothetical protein
MLVLSNLSSRVDDLVRRSRQSSWKLRHTFVTIHRAAQATHCVAWRNAPEACYGLWPHAQIRRRSSAHLREGVENSRSKAFAGNS